MQKSGLVDTMWDLIVDGVGGLIISLGWTYLQAEGNDSFLERWIESFHETSPGIFNRNAP